MEMGRCLAAVKVGNTKTEMGRGFVAVTAGSTKNGDKKEIRGRQGRCN